MINFYGVFTLFSREVSRFRKIFIDTMIGPLGSNILYIIIFGVTLGKTNIVPGINFLNFLIPGLIGLTLINSSFSNPSFAFVIAKFSGTITDLLIAPLSGSGIVLAYAAAATVRALSTATVTLLVSYLFTVTPIFHPFLLIVGALLTAFFFANVGIFAGYMSKQFEHLTMITTFIMTPMTFLGGTFYRISSLPEYAQLLSHLNPMYYFISYIRYSMIDITDIKPNISLLVMISFCTALFTLNNYLFRNGKRLRT